MSKSRKVIRTAPIDEFTEENTTTYVPAVAPTVTETTPFEKVLSPYLSDGLLTVRVVVAHDALFVGDVVRMPMSERVAGLLEIGFLEVEYDAETQS